MTPDHAFYMQLALNEAWKYQGLTYPNPAVGTLLLDSTGKILSISAHKEAGKPHAEVLALQESFAILSGNSSILSLTDSHAIHDYLMTHHQGLFKTSTLYVTLEPCNHTGKTPPCAALIESLGIKTVIIGCKDPNPQASGGIKRLTQSGATVISGILEKECHDLIEPFVLWNKKRFVFMKWAQTLNGIVDGGRISGEESQKRVHRLRDKTDLLIIGGETVRKDRPTLDARLVNGKAPDVLILSKTSDFDHSIPLFNVPDRKVHVADSPLLLEQYNFIMCESGGGLFEILKKYLDWNLTIIAPRLATGKPFFATANQEHLHVQQSCEDSFQWSRLTL